MKNNNQIASEIKKIMKARNISASELAKKVNMTDELLKHMLNGTRGYVFTQGMLVSICDALDVECNQLIQASNLEPVEKEEYEKNALVLFLNYIGVYINHLMICDDLVFSRNESTDYLYMCGDRVMSVEEMEGYSEKCEDVEDCYEVYYRDLCYRLTSEQYNHLINVLANIMVEYLQTRLSEYK